MCLYFANGKRATQTDLWGIKASPLMNLACSRRSDSGERCEVKRSAKKIKSSPPLLFTAFFTLHRSPLSERLEQVIMNQTCLAKLNRLGCWSFRKIVAKSRGEFYSLKQNLYMHVARFTGHSLRADTLNLVYSVCELVHNIVFESHRVART